MKIQKSKLCFYTSIFNRPTTVSEMIRAAVAFGVGGVEFMNFYGELTTPDISAARELAKEAADAGLKVPCFSVGANMLTDEESTLKKLCSYADICADVGIPYLHHTVCPDFECGALTPHVREDRFMRGAQQAIKLSEYAQSVGVRTLIEDQGFVFNGVEACMKLNRMSDGRIGFVADFGNILFHDEEPHDFVRAAGKHVCHAHVKDYTVAKSPTNSGVWYKTRLSNYLHDAEIGTGDIDFELLGEAFREIGYGGMYALEFANVEDLCEIGRVIDRLTR